MNTPQNPLDPASPEAIASRVATFNTLHYRFWEEVGNIGRCDGFFLSRTDESGLIGYAEGVKNVLLCCLESLQGSTTERDERCNRSDASGWSHQIDGALGEQLRRRNPQGKQCDGVFLNRVLCDIRDRRIAMIDQCEEFDWTWSRETRRKLERWAQTPSNEKDTEKERRIWDTYQRVQHELAALDGLWSHLIGDRDFQRRRYEKISGSAAVAKNLANAMEVAS